MKKQKGQTLIEAVVALVTILLIVTAIAIVIVSGLYNSSYVKAQNEANKHAQEGIEFVRNIQQNDIEAFASYNAAGGIHCIDYEDNVLEICEGDTVNIGGTYIRTITFASATGTCHDSELRVTVAVAWSSSKCAADNRFCHKSELISCMPFDYPASDP